MLDPAVAGLASVHGCIGAVDPVRTFGNAEQKQRFLPRLASGKRLSAFALTEPGAGSDLTALKTRADLDGDRLRRQRRKAVHHQRRPRPHDRPGLPDRQASPPCSIVDLPDAENEQFQLRKYGLYALKHTYNQGIMFNHFRVPRENLLTPDARRRSDDRLSRPEPRPHLAVCATATGDVCG